MAIIKGTSAKNTLTGTAGNDIISGMGGADILAGFAGRDALYGGAGNDVLRGGNGNDKLLGADGNDKLSGDAGNDVLQGGIGNDALSGGDGNDKLYGEAGNDFLSGGRGSDRLNGGSGADVMHGGSGNDRYVVDNAADVTVDTGGIDSVTASVSYVLGTGIDHATLSAGAAAIRLTGNGLANVLTGNAGNNILNGGAGADILDGGGGDDLLSGGTGNDIYIIDSIHDSVTDSGGTDLVRSSASYVLGGGIENAQLLGSAALQLVGHGGDNVLTGNDGDNVISGGGGHDTFVGGKGDDILIGGSDAESFDGGDGIDTVSYLLSNAGLAVRLDLDNLIVAAGAAAGDTFTSIENVFGTNISGTGDEIHGNAVANRIYTGNGNDLLFGGGGGDTLNGEAGNDIIDPGSDGSADLILGGAGTDTLSYFSSATAVLVGLDFSNLGASVLGGGALHDTCTSIENLTGSTHDDNLRISHYDGTPGQGIVAGGLGNDRVQVDGGGSALGGAGNDTLLGTGGSSETLTGGDGRDVFVLELGGGDLITDFTVEAVGGVANADRLSIVENFGVNGGAGGFNLHNAITGHDATVAAAQFIFDSSTQQLWYDGDGTSGGAGQLLATLQGFSGPLSSADFVLT